MGASSRPIRRATTTSDTYPIHEVKQNARQGGKPGKVKLTKHGLEEMLDWGLEQEEKCKQMLKVLVPEMEEYQQILEKLEKCISVNEQVRQQIAAKRR